MKCPECFGMSIIKRDGIGQFCTDCGIVLKDYFDGMRKDNIFIGKLDKCNGCGSMDNLSRHHVKPKREFGSGKVIVLCRYCHNVADFMCDILYPELELKNE